MSGPVTVAHVITRLDVGGAQATAVRTCALLDRDRYRPLLVCGSDAGSGGSMMPDAEQAEVEVVRMPSLVAPIRPGADVRALRHLTRLLVRRRVAVVHTHSSKAGAIGRLAAHRADRPVVHTVHGWSFHEGQRPAVRAGYLAIERWLSSRTDAWVVVTPTDQELGLDVGIGQADRYHLVRSGIGMPAPATAEVRERIRREQGWSDREVVLVAVGRLAPQKDPLTLLDALARVVPAYPHVRLALVGDGPLRDAVASRVTELGLQDHVQAVGVRSDVFDLLAGADGYVSSARWEGLPRTVLEAVAMGVPVVTTDVGGVRDIIEDGVSGLLVPSADPDALATMLKCVLDAPVAAASRAAIARQSIGEFDEQVMATRTMAIYDAVRRDPGGLGL